MRHRISADGPRIRPIPGELLLHPFAIAAVMLLVANDLLLKDIWPGTATGKLSDFAGLVVFALLLASLAEFVRLLARRSIVVDGDAWLWPAICAVGFVFVKITSVGNDSYAWAVGFVRWPSHVVASVFNHEAAPGVQPILVARDPTDLFALIVLSVPYILIRARRANSRKCLVEAPVAR